MNPAGIFHYASPSVPWPPVEVYETCEDDGLTKFIALRGGRGTLILAPTTTGADLYMWSGRLLWTVAARLKQRGKQGCAVSTHTLLLSIVFVHQSGCEYFACTRPSTERLKGGVCETSQGRVMKRNSSPADSDPLETPIWRNEPTSQYRNAINDNARENRKKDKAERENKWILDTIRKRSFILSNYFNFVWLYSLSFRDQRAGERYDSKMKSERVQSKECACVRLCLFMSSLSLTVQPSVSERLCWRTGRVAAACQCQWAVNPWHHLPFDVCYISHVFTLEYAGCWGLGSAWT